VTFRAQSKDLTLSKLRDIDVYFQVEESAHKMIKRIKKTDIALKVIRKKMFVVSSAYKYSSDSEVKQASDKSVLNLLKNQFIGREEDVTFVKDEGFE